MGLLVGFVLLSSGCASVRIAPRELADVQDRMEERDSDLKRWTNAVSLCNEFLRSPERKTLPFGRVDFGDEGMGFLAGSSRLPIRVRCTSWGDALIPLHFSAQERSDGFVVGLVPPRKSRLLDNSFFKDNDGKPESSAIIACLILHELTHSYYQMGTVDFVHGFTYYVEAIFLMRYRNHSQERVPYQTDDEFWRFISRKSPAPRRRPEGRPSATKERKERIDDLFGDGSWRAFTEGRGGNRVEETPPDFRRFRRRHSESPELGGLREDHAAKAPG